MGLVAFIAMACLDIVYARYTKAAASGKTRAAVLYSCLSYLAGVSMTLVLVSDPWLMPWSLAGVAVGTYLGVRETTDSLSAEISRAFARPPRAYRQWNGAGWSPY